LPYYLLDILRYVISCRFVSVTLTSNQSTVYALAEKIADDIKRSW
jgi:hypothetical protein